MKEIIYDYLRKKLGNDVELEVEVMDFFSPTTKIVEIEINGYYYSLMVDEGLGVFGFIRILNSFYGQYIDSVRLEENAKELCDLLSEVLDEEVKYDGEYERRYFYIGDEDDKEILCTLNKRGRIEFWSDYIFEPEVLIEIAKFYRDNY